MKQSVLLKFIFNVNRDFDQVEDLPTNLKVLARFCLACRKKGEWAKIFIWSVILVVLIW